MSHSLKFALLSVVLLGLVIPTGAVVTGSMDDVFSKNGVVMQPYDGPNGQYAEIGEDNELSIDVTDPGVNNDGVTVIRQVFVIENQGERPATVWLTHDAMDGVNLYENITSGVLDAQGIARQSLQGDGNQSTIAPGERIVVSLAIDTNSRESKAGDMLLEQISLHVQQEDETPTDTETPTPTDTETETPTSTETPAEQSNQTEEPTPAPTPTENQTEEPTPTETESTPVAENETVEVQVQFSSPDLENESVNVTDVDPDSVPESGDSDSDPGPQPVITSQSSDSQQQVNQTAPNVSGVDSIVTANEEATLDASRSTIDRTDGVDSQQRVLKAAEISPRKGLEKQSATVRMWVSKEKLGNTAPENARLGHMTKQGWQLLETRVVDESNESVLLEAQTPGFSLFAVFANPEVTYEWTLPDGTVVEGSSIQARFSEPGYYNVTLTVTDAYGNSNSTQSRILVNDVPELTIETPENASVGDEVQLAANVTNQYGNTTVTWELPDGSTTTGRTVNYTIQEESPEIEVTVTDEYGANSTATATIPTGGAQVGAEPGQADTIVGNQFQVVSWILLVGFIVFLMVMLYRLTNLELQNPSAWVTSLIRKRGRPQISHLENPRWDARRGRFEIERLRVEATKDVLETVVISLVTADGTEVARKRIDVGRRDKYEASPEFIPGIPSSSVDPAGSYSVRVQAVDSRNREDFATNAIQMLSSSSGSGTEMWSAD